MKHPESSASSTRTAKTARKRRALAALAVAAALVLLWLLRGCLGPGLGGGAGQDSETIDARPSPDVDGDAGGGAGDAALAVGPCELRLSASGLTVNGADASVAEAVRICGASGAASLELTGGARAGTYRELRRALEDADVSLSEEQWPEWR